MHILNIINSNGGIFKLRKRQAKYIPGLKNYTIRRNILAYGNLEKYKYGNDVIDFLKKHNVKPVYLSDGKLVDRGSILVVDTE